MTPFCFEHVFRTAGVADVFAAYFDAEHQRRQDDVLAIASREVLDLTDGGDVLVRRCRVVPQRQLPAVVRPFVAGELAYVETATWRRRDDLIELDIQPSLLGGRARITGTYKLEQRGADAVHRRYAGEVRVDLPLIAGRVERGIAAEFAAGVPKAAAVTQHWLDCLIPRVSSGIISA
jgi:hypothetical protein|nr:DUF2505 domain-containing protein [Kofleriaceae bacterium]